MSTEIGDSGSSGTALTQSVDSNPAPSLPTAEKSVEKTSSGPVKGSDRIAEKISSKATSAGATDGPAKPNITPIDGDTQSSPPVYQPNYKFKANQKEMEFDEFLRSAVKDPETEKKVRELYEKAYGLDTIKPERDQLKAQHQAVTQEFNQIKGGLAKASQYVQQKDYQSFFQAMGIPESDIMQFALLKVQLAEATPEQRAAYEQSRTTTLNAQQLAEQNQHLQTTLRQQASTMRANELDLALQRPEVNALMQAFDQRLGKVGAFRDEVIKRGQLYWHNAQADIPVDQAVQEVMSLIGNSLTPQMTQPAAPTAQTLAEPPEQRPTIPSLKGRGTSPAKKVFRSIAELKKHAKELETNG
jgi:hypothetical protein